jgi:amidohydrolase
LRWSERVDAELEKELVQWRRHLHSKPELSFQEHETTEFIGSLLAGWGIEIDRPLDTGLIGRVRGSEPGPVVAVRADIDALPVQEENDADFASTVPSRMHACGHDGHTAILLGLAKTLSELRPQLSGEIRLVFQPAEEVVASGARQFVDKGVLDGVVAMLGLHLWSGLDVGSISIGGGAIMASTDEFRVTVLGSGGHGAVPHQAIDSLVIASSLVGELQTLVSRRIDPLDPAVVSVGSFHAGTAFNVIPGVAELTGTVRTLSEPVRALIERELRQIATSHVQAGGARTEVRYLRGNPTLVNDAELVEVLRPALAAVDGVEIVSLPPSMGGEDFAYYSEVVPSVFGFVGARNPDIGADFPHHHPRFSIDERSLGIGLRFFLAGVERLNSGSERLPRFSNA